MPRKDQFPIKTDVQKKNLSETLSLLASGFDQDSACNDLLQNLVFCAPWSRLYNPFHTWACFQLYKFMQFFELSLCLFSLSVYWNFRKITFLIISTAALTPVLQCAKPLDNYGRTMQSKDAFGSSSTIVYETQSFSSEAASLECTFPKECVVKEFWNYLLRQALLLCSRLMRQFPLRRWHYCLGERFSSWSGNLKQLLSESRNTINKFVFSWFSGLLYNWLSGIKQTYSGSLSKNILAIKMSSGKTSLYNGTKRLSVFNKCY